MLHRKNVVISVSIILPSINGDELDLLRKAIPTIHMLVRFYDQIAPFPNLQRLLAAAARSSEWPERTSIQLVKGIFVTRKVRRI